MVLGFGLLYLPYLFPKINHSIMKQQVTTKILFFLSGLLILGSCAKPACDPCQDPALVTVPAEDLTPPTGQWYFSQEVSHEDGTLSSSISMVEDPSVPVSLTLKNNTRTTIQFEGTDSESGIKCLQFEGGFGFTCVQPVGTALTGHGMLPSTSRCTGLTTCGMVKQTMSMDYLEQYFLSCSPPYSFASGDAAITAVAENMKGVKDTFTLSVSFIPATY
jgi:hypothetical protein